jgi:hypothetical protein
VFVSAHNVDIVDIVDRVSLAELIADCAAIPVPPPLVDQAYYPLRVAEPWQVDDACYALVRELDEYV